jgi:hypothetical protein
LEADKVKGEEEDSEEEGREDAKVENEKVY